MPSDGAAVIVLGLFIIVCALFRLETLALKITLLIGVLLLVLAAVVFATGKEELASGLATYAYFALVGGVILVLIERVRARRKRNASGSPSGRTPGTED